MKNKIEDKIYYLEEMGLIIDNKEKFEWYLKNIGFYRLSRYFINFKDINNKIDLKGVKSEEIINNYLFDKKLRLLILDITEVVENSLKNLFILFIGNNYNDKKIYSDEKIRDGKTKSENTIDFINEKIKILIDKDNDYRKNKNYEIFINKLTFGEIVRLYRNLKKDYKYDILNYYNILNLKILDNWLLSLKYIRNLSSHSENIFNRIMTNKILGKNISLNFGLNYNDRFISYFVIINIFKNILIPNYKFEEKVFQYMDKYDINIELFGIKKETFHSELNLEAWKVLVHEVYTKYVRKSNKY